MVIGVLGGSGQAGAATMAELARRGHRAIALSRTAPEGVEHRHVDVTTGAGLAFAMSGLDAVVETLNGDAAVHVEGTERALAAACDARVGHVVSLSAAGAGRIPVEYHRVKRRQEEVVRLSGVPFSIVRAAQFHSLLDLVFATTARRRLLPLLKVPIQPVDGLEVAAHLADLVEAGPTGTAMAFAGPRVERMDQLARDWAKARGVRALKLRVPGFLPVVRQTRAGALIYPDAVRGQVTFAEFLTGVRPTAPLAVAA